MPSTLWYENIETKVQWHVELGSEAQLRLATDPNYRLLDLESKVAVTPTLSAVIAQNQPATPTRVIVSGPQAPKGKV